MTVTRESFDAIDRYLNEADAEVAYLSRPQLPHAIPKGLAELGCFRRNSRLLTIPPQLQDSLFTLSTTLSATMQALRNSAASALRHSQRRAYTSASSPYAETAKNLMIVSCPSFHRSALGDIHGNNLA